MSINLKIPDIRELKPRLTVFGVGGAGGNAVNNMITAGLQGVDFVVANTDAQALTSSKAERVIQMGVQVTEGLGAGSQPDVGRAAAEEVIDEIRDHLSGAHMVFVTAGMGGGTGTGAAPVIARVAKELGILTVGVVTKPFHFEGQRRMKFAEAGIAELQKCVDTQIIIPNQNLFRVANEKTTFADAFAMADQVLYSGVACITDLMVKEGLINLDFADVRAIMREMGKAMMGTGEASGEKRALRSAEAAIANPLIDDVSMKGARGLLISISGGKDLTLYEVDEAATRIREEVDQDANIILGATFDEELEGVIRVSVVATGIDKLASEISPAPAVIRQMPKPAQQATISEGRPVAAHAPEPQRAHEPARAEDPVAEAIRLAEAGVPRQQAARQHAEDDFRPQSRIFPAPAAEQPRIAQPAAHVDHDERAPQHVAAAAPRMPRVEDFPPAVRAELEARQSPASADHDERGPMGLLKRLTHGLSRREEEPARLQPAQPREPKLRQPVPEARRLASQDPAVYAPRRGQIDEHGRLVPQTHATHEDDQLEIPAFLRRQAN
jgi:cell division protein FtsZ